MPLSLGMMTSKIAREGASFSQSFKASSPSQAESTRYPRFHERLPEIEENDLRIHDFERGDQRRDRGNVGQFKTVLSLRVESAQRRSGLIRVKLLQATRAASFRSSSLPRFHCGPWRTPIDLLGSRTRCESGIDPHAKTLQASQLNWRDWRGSPLGKSLHWKGFVHFALEAAGVKQTSLEVSETLRALPGILCVPQEKRR